MLDWPRPDGPCGEPWRQVGNPVLVDLREVLDIIDRYASAWRHEALADLVAGGDRTDSCTAKATVLEAMKLVLIEQLGQPMRSQEPTEAEDFIRGADL